MLIKIKAFVLLLFSVQFCCAQPDLKKNLLAWYPFNGNALDESGNNNNPVFNNATLTYDKETHQSYYYFNGVDQFIRIPNSSSLNAGNQITISARVMPMGFYHGVCHASSVISKGGGNYNMGNYALRFDDALYSEGAGCGGYECDSLHQNFRGTGTTFKSYTPYINKFQWYQVVYTNDGETAKLYVDCQLKYAVKFLETFTNNEDLFFGKSDDQFFPFWFKGYLDDVRIYNRALDTNAIFAICHSITENEKRTDTVKPLHLEKRMNKLAREIFVDHDSVTVSLYDNGIVDGDSVTLLFNKEILTRHLLLTEKAVSFKIKIDRNSPNELIMYAENMGTIPPNTALMVIYDGEKRYEVNVRSTEDTNGTVIFKLK